MKKGKNKARKARKEDYDSVWTLPVYYKETVTPKRLSSRDNVPTRGNPLGRKWVRT